MKRSAQGFTLVEVLMVVVILGIVASVVVIGFTGADRQRGLIREAKRLALVVEMARDESVLSGLEYGLDILEDGYQFLVYDVDRERWTTLSESPYGAHEIMQGVALDLVIDDFALDPARFMGGDGDEAKPEVVILSSGELTPFSMQFVPGWDGPHWVVSSDGLALVEATPRSSPEKSFCSISRRSFGRQPPRYARILSASGECCSRNSSSTYR